MIERTTFESCRPSRKVAFGAPSLIHEVWPFLWCTRRNSRQPCIQPLEITTKRRKQETNIEEITETQEIKKFHFQAPPMLFQNFPRQLPTHSTVTLFPEPKLCFFKTFVQRRWVYLVAEATS